MSGAVKIAKTIVYNNRDITVVVKRMRALLMAAGLWRKPGTRMGNAAECARSAAAVGRYACVRR
jgi:hypothetical protein